MFSKHDIGYLDQIKSMPSKAIVLPIIRENTNKNKWRKHTYTLSKENRDMPLPVIDLQKNGIICEHF